MNPIYLARIVAFIKTSVRNEWIYHEHIHIYVRKGFHALPETPFVRDTFDVATVNVDEAMQRQGIFTAWLTIAEQQAKKHGFAAVFVESVLNPQLAQWLARRGYSKMGPDECPNYYRYCVDIPIIQTVTSASAPSAVHPNS